MSSEFRISPAIRLRIDEYVDAVCLAAKLDDAEILPASINLRSHLEERFIEVMESDQWKISDEKGLDHVFQRMGSANSVARTYRKSVLFRLLFYDRHRAERLMLIACYPVVTAANNVSRLHELHSTRLAPLTTTTASVADAVEHANRLWIEIESWRAFGGDVLQSIGTAAISVLCVLVARKLRDISRCNQAVASAVTASAGIVSLSIWLKSITSAFLYLWAYTLVVYASFIEVEALGVLIMSVCSIGLGVVFLPCVAVELGFKHTIILVRSRFRMLRS